jgi:hypothetical protein
VKADVFRLLVRSPAIFETGVEQEDRVIGGSRGKDARRPHRPAGQRRCLYVVGAPVRVFEVYPADPETRIGLEVDGQRADFDALLEPLHDEQIAVSAGIDRFRNFARQFRLQGEDPLIEVDEEGYVGVESRPAIVDLQALDRNRLIEIEMELHEAGIRVRTPAPLRED